MGRFNFNGLRQSVNTATEDFEEIPKEQLSLLEDGIKYRSGLPVPATEDVGRIILGAVIGGLVGLVMSIITHYFGRSKRLSGAASRSDELDSSLQSVLDQLNRDDRVYDKLMKDDAFVSRIKRNSILRVFALLTLKDYTKSLISITSDLLDVIEASTKILGDASQYSEEEFMNAFAALYASEKSKSILTELSFIQKKIHSGKILPPNLFDNERLSFPKVIKSLVDEVKKDYAEEVPEAEVEKTLKGLLNRANLMGQISFAGYLSSKDIEKLESKFQRLSKTMESYKRKANSTEIATLDTPKSAIDQATTFINMLLMDSNSVISIIGKTITDANYVKDKIIKTFEDS